MARMPVLSWKPPAIAVRAAVVTNPSMVAVAKVGALRLKSTWLSFHDGLGASVHALIEQVVVIVS